MLWLALQIFLAGVALAQEDDEKKLEALKKEISTLQSSLRRAGDKRDRLAKNLRETELKAAKLRETAAQLEADMAILDRELTQLDQRQAALDALKNRQMAQVSRELAAAYRFGRQEPLKLLFNLDRAADMGRAMTYYRYIVNARSEIIRGFRLTLEELEVLAVEKRARQARLAGVREEQRGVLEALANELSERQVLLSKADDKFRDDKHRLAKVKLEAQQLEEIIAKLAVRARELASPNDKPFAERKGKLTWPVKGSLRHGYGTARKADLKWSGWLLLAEEASAVKSVYHGRVVFADYLRGHGLVLIIDHGGGYLSLYAHLQLLLKEVGDWVSESELIARVGNTGGLARSALYFELRRNGRPVDPKPWLRAKA